MARPKKIGLDYFPLDVDFDDKVKAIEMLFENDGLVWIIKFWQSAYKTQHGELDIRGLFGELLAKNSRITIEKQEKILSACEQIGLFYKTESGFYTSNGIKKRISGVSGERKSAIERQEDKKKEKDSIVKESKVKETPHYSANNSRIIPNNPEYTEPSQITKWGLSKQWAAYRDVRIKAGKPVTEYSEEMLIKRLLDMPECDRAASLEQSILNGWFYLQPPIKTVSTKPQQQNNQGVVIVPMNKKPLDISAIYNDSGDK